MLSWGHHMFANTVEYPAEESHLCNILVCWVSTRSLPWYMQKTVLFLHPSKQILLLTAQHPLKLLSHIKVLSSCPPGNLYLAYMWSEIEILHGSRAYRTNHSHPSSFHDKELSFGTVWLLDNIKQCYRSPYMFSIFFFLPSFKFLLIFFTTFSLLYAFLSCLFF